MSKWIDALNASNKARIQQSIEKLDGERKQFRREYNDRPWDTYQKAIESREKEIEELQSLLNPKDLIRELEDYKEEVTRLRRLLAKVNILADTMDPATEIAFNNQKQLTHMTNPYTSEFVEMEFKEKAKQGTW